MPKLILKTGKPIDGEYDVDMTWSEFSMREKARMAAICAAFGTPAYGYELLSRFFSGDGAAIVAVTTVMLERAGRLPDVDALADVSDEAIRYDYSDLEPESDDGPPFQPPSANDELGGNSDESKSSG